MDLTPTTFCSLSNFVVWNLWFNFPCYKWEVFCWVTEEVGLQSVYLSLPNPYSDGILTDYYLCFTSVQDFLTSILLYWYRFHLDFLRRRTMFLKDFKVQMYLRTVQVMSRRVREWGLGLEKTLRGLQLYPSTLESYKDSDNSFSFFQPFLLSDPYLSGKVMLKQRCSHQVPGYPKRLS